MLEDQGGLEELRRLGARSVPVVSRGDRFVFAQVISDVVEFLGLDEKTGPALSPARAVDAAESRSAFVMDMDKTGAPAAWKAP